MPDLELWECLGQMLDHGVTGPCIMPSLMHHLSSVKGWWGTVRTLEAPTPLQQGRRGSLELLHGQMGLVCYMEIAVFSCCVSKRNPNWLMSPPCLQKCQRVFQLLL